MYLKAQQHQRLLVKDKQEKAFSPYDGLFYSSYSRNYCMTHLMSKPFPLTNTDSKGQIILSCYVRFFHGPICIVDFSPFLPVDLFQRNVSWSSADGVIVIPQGNRCLKGNADLNTAQMCLPKPSSLKLDFFFNAHHACLISALLLRSCDLGTGRDTMIIYHDLKKKKRSDHRLSRYQKKMIPYFNLTAHNTIPADNPPQVLNWTKFLTVSKSMHITEKAC